MNSTDLQAAPAGARRGRWARRLLLVLLIVLVSAGGLVEGMRRFFLPRRVTAAGAARLSEALGVPVQVAGADVGWGSSSLRGVRLFENGPEQTEALWADIDALEIDVSLLGLLSGETAPRRLNLRGAAFTLRFSADGRLATELPKGGTGQSQPLPDVHLEDARITLREAGRADLVIGGIAADLHAEGGEVELRGTVSDPLWSGWAVQSVLHRPTGALSLTLRNEQVAVDEAMLARLPFVPPGVWRQLHVEGETAVELLLRTDPASRSVHYRVALEPRSAGVYIPGIDLRAGRAGGKVLIEDGLVRLEEMRGEAAGGEIVVRGHLDFRGRPARLDLKVDALNLDVSSLPKSWSVPKGATGKLSTQLTFQVPLADGP